MKRVSTLITAVAMVLLTASLFAAAHAATIDTPRVDGYVVMPGTGTTTIVEVDMDSEPGSCDALAATLDAHFKNQEQTRASQLGLSNYSVQTSIVCKHRLTTVPDTISNSVCEITVDASSDVNSVIAACPALSP